MPRERLTRPRLAHRYLHLDVFTDRALSGNQLAVFPDAGAIDEARMQAIALEMAFSETTFVLPASAPDTDVRMRIFTPRHELPMAGHPTVGSTFALAAEGVIAPGREQFVFGLGVGPTPVTLQWRGDALAFAWMRQPLPTFGTVFADLEAVAAALALAPQDILTAMPVQQVSAGVPVLLVPLASRRAVDAAELDLARIRALYAAHGAQPTAVYVFSTAPGDDGASVYSRMFAPMFGIAEDPATGGACGPLGCYLLRHGAVSAEAARTLITAQGVKMGRPSRIHIDIDSADDATVREVRVGGQAVLVGEGTLTL